MSRFFASVLRYLTTLMGIVMGPLALGIVWFKYGADLVLGFSVDMVQRLLDYTLPGASFNLIDTAAVPLARANAIIPLSENWGMMLAYLSLATWVILYRWIAKLVPVIES